MMVQKNKIENVIYIIENIINQYVENVVPIAGGVTNDSYLFSSNHKKYVIRIPGKFTNDYIDRKSEIYNMKIIQTLHIMPHVIYACEQSGILITEYLNNPKPLCYEDILYDDNIILKFIQILYNLHNSNLKFYKEFDILHILTKYKIIYRNIGGLIPHKLYNIQSILDNKVISLFKNLNKNLVPCHVDPKFNNFVVSENQLFLLDWEYSNMADKYFDLANIVLTNDLSSSDENKFIQSYFIFAKEKYDNKKFILYKIMTDYLWIYWHLIKIKQEENILYNTRRWQERLNRILENHKVLEVL